MKKLRIPKVKNSFTDANWIKEDLEIRLAKNKRAHENLTLYGAYKKIRRMYRYAALGDYIILSQCVSFFKYKNLKFSEKEIYRCFRYFEDYKSGNWNHYKSLTRNLTPSFF